MTNAVEIGKILIASHGWHRADDTGRAELRRSSGIVSLGHDGTVVEFFRRHPDGYGLRNLEMGVVDLTTETPESGASAVLAML